MDTVRLQIDLDEEQMKTLAQMMAEGKVRTKKELFNAALTLLRWAMKERKAGRIIASVDVSRDSYKELEMPVLSEVRAETKAV
jgi:Arc/MetJ family transcription regulator